MKTVYVRGDFIVCPNPLSADSYSMCEYNCRYCFIQEMYHTMMTKTRQKGLLPTDLKELKRILHKAFDTKKEYSNLTINALRDGLPVIVGRKCEPFCPSEQKYHNTMKMINLFSDYGVKSIIECKGTLNLGEEKMYNRASGVLVSIPPAPGEYHNKLEPGTPTYSERFKFARRMSEVGLFVGLTAEPLLPTIADKDGILLEYGQKALESGVSHVNFGEYRAHLPKISQKRLNEVEISLRDILHGMRHWKNLGTNFMYIMHAFGLKCSTPDWVNFGFDNDCEGCCGLDKFGVQTSSFQHAIQVLKHKSRVKLSDIIDITFLTSEDLKKVTPIWNGDGKHYTLSDIDGVYSVDIDEFGNKVYGKTRNRSLL